MKRFLLTVLLVVLPLRAGTVAHYKFERSKPNSPVYELTDSSGNGHHGAVVGQELFELTPDVPPYPGVTGEALDLRGRLDYAVIPHHADFAPTGSWTIEFFIKADLFHQESGGETNIAKGYPSASMNTNLAYTVLAKQNTNEVTRFGSAWAFHYLPAEGHLVFTISHGTNGGQVFTASSDLRDGKWHHIAIVFAASQFSEIRVFQDGFRWQSSNIGTPSFAWGNGPIYVGAWARRDFGGSIQDRNFDGYLDEIRLSDSALDTETFVVNFAPFLYAPIVAEAFMAFELQFEAEAGKIYRIENGNSESGGWTLGYVVGEGGPKSFFHRRDFFSPPNYRVVPVGEAAAAPVSFAKFEAIELRFQSEPNQLFLIKRCETLNCLNAEEVYLLGDGAKMSYFERTVPNQSRYYTIERY